MLNYRTYLTTTTSPAKIRIDGQLPPRQLRQRQQRGDQQSPRPSL